jgi:hypothetical protein
MTENEWIFGFNDPRLSGWVITLAYLVAFALCLRAWIKAKKSSITAAAGNIAVLEGSAYDSKGGGLWLLFAAILFLLGVNKQLDLQTLLGDVGRSVSTAQGWYEKRRAVQAVFVLVFAIICGIVAILIVKSSGKRRGGYGITPVGIVLSIFIIVLRAGLIAHVDDVLPVEPARIPRRVYSFFELFGVFLAGLGAFIMLIRQRRRKIKEFKFDWEKQ